MVHDKTKYQFEPAFDEPAEVAIMGEVGTIVGTVGTNGILEGLGVGPIIEVTLPANYYTFLQASATRATMRVRDPHYRAAADDPADPTLQRLGTTLDLDGDEAAVLHCGWRDQWCLFSAYHKDFNQKVRDGTYAQYVRNCDYYGVSQFRASKEEELGVGEGTHSDSSNTMLIVAIAAGSVVAVCCIGAAVAVVVLCVLRKNKQNERDFTPAQYNTNNGTPMNMVGANVPDMESARLSASTASYY